MQRADGVLAIYSNAQICLWVEDPETKAYLDALWSDGRIRTLVGGGAGAIANLANAVRQDAQQNVYALQDRDFGVARGPSSTHSGPVFVVDRHEVENYLIDEHAIANSMFNTRRVDAAAVASFAEKRAGELVAWMASRRVLRDVWSMLHGNFPEDPSPAEIVDMSTATAWLTARTGSLGASSAQIASIVANELAKHHATYATAARNGTWRTEFSGKEIFEPLVGWVWHTKKPGGTKARTMVAGAIGERQRMHQNVPTELAHLRVFLLDQWGLTP